MVCSVMPSCKASAHGRHGTMWLWHSFCVQCLNKGSGKLSARPKEAEHSCFLACPLPLPICPSTSRLLLPFLACFLQLFFPLTFLLPISPAALLFFLLAFLQLFFPLTFLLPVSPAALLGLLGAGLPHPLPMQQGVGGWHELRNLHLVQRLRAQPVSRVGVSFDHRTFHWLPAPLNTRS